MDVKKFVDELLGALADTECFSQVTLQAEGPIVSGYAYTQGDVDLFLRVYFNETTGTVAFALINKQQRIWGIDYDNRREWHLHPVENPTKHVQIGPLSISEIVIHLIAALSAHESSTN